MEKIHSMLRWVLLILMLVVLYRSWKGKSQKLSFTADDNRFSLFLMIAADLQLLLGLILYFTSAKMDAIRQMATNDIMKNTFARFYFMEHIAMMIIAIALIHIGRSASKKATSDEAKHKKLFWFTFIALILILASIPWPFRNLGGSWI